MGVWVRAPGPIHARTTVTVLVSHDMLTIELDDGIRTVRRTTTDPIFQVNAIDPQSHTNLGVTGKIRPEADPPTIG